MKNNLFYKIDKKAQVGDTITWLVATIIILVILGASIFASSITGKAMRIYTHFGDERKDFIATKSISSFLLKNNQNLDDSLEKENYVLLDNLLNPFLYDSGVFQQGWVVSISSIKEKKLKKSYSLNPSSYRSFPYCVNNYFYISSGKYIMDFGRCYEKSD